MQQNFEFKFFKSFSRDKQDFQIHTKGEEHDGGKR